MTDDQGHEAPVPMPIERPKVNHAKTYLGLGLTAGYLVAMGVYVAVQRHAFLAMSSADFGDFLAGVFAPLAFLWLVLGFFQQGEELRHSAGALWLQGEELRNSVEQQRQLVVAQRDQLQWDKQRLEAERAEVKRQAQPDFIVTGGGYGTNVDGKLTTMHLGLLNRGRTCSDFRLDVEGKALRNVHFETGAKMEFHLDIPLDFPIGVRDYKATYVDALGYPGEQKVQVKVVKAGDRNVFKPR